MNRLIIALTLATTLGTAIGAYATTARAEIPMTAVGPHAVADVVENVNQTVVYIQTSIPKPVKETPQAKPVDPQAQPEGQAEGKPGDKFNHAIGAGFIFSTNGLIVTNEHVIKGATSIKVTLLDGKIFDAKVVAADEETDIAVLKIEASGLPVTPLGSSAAMRVGDFVIAIGNPFNFDHTVTSGIVSALHRQLGESENMIQTDAAINPGNSGGPLFNISGEAIAINEAMFGGPFKYVGIGLAIPMDDAKAIIQQLIMHGSVPHAFVGIQMTEQAPAPGTEEPAIVIVDIKPGGPADQSLIKNDIIRKVDGKKVNSVGNVLHNVKRHVPGDTIIFQVLRDGKLIDVPVKSGNRSTGN